jgi:hypothetical protein
MICRSSEVEMISSGRTWLPAFRFVSPERRWRAAFMGLPAAWFGLADI